MSETLTLASTEQRRSALGQDVLLFCGAFTAGVLVFSALYIFSDVFSNSSGIGSDYWSVGLSDALMLSGLIGGELFMLWNNGIRQGHRGHSIGKHRIGIRVVDTNTGEPTGAARGFLRGLILVLLLDLSVAAIPVGFPTVLRDFAPESLRFGGAAYLALAVLVIPFLFRARRGFADVVAHTKVMQAVGADATLGENRRRVLMLVDVVGVLGVLAVAANYIAFYSPLLFRFPSFF
ncbi:MAG: RDD family protein [Propionibacteriales bacterium]|nr:RDD family protein [Propionibacteriales bacterium]